MVEPNVPVDTSTIKKMTKGKQKIVIKKIEETNRRQDFTGAQIAIQVTSPGGGQVYAFPHSNNDVLFDSSLNNNNKDATTSNNTGAETGTTQNYQPPPAMKESNKHYTEVPRELEAEKKLKETIPVSRGGLRWYDEPVDGMDVEELELYLCSLEELKNKVLTRADELMMINSSKNNIIQPEDISTNTAVDGGLNFKHGDDFGNL
ncbi:hypothetical protein LXL04_019485 [Taraxacum kok-saghyz]